MRKRKILEFVLPPTYQKKLNSEGWFLSEKTYNKSIRKITEVEPEILLKIKEMEKTRENAKAIEELQEKVSVVQRVITTKASTKTKIMVLRRVMDQMTRMVIISAVIAVKYTILC